MGEQVEGLIAWLRKELDSSEQQIELFGAKGVKAMLLLPDGQQQDITARVLEHQRDQVSRLPDLIAALERIAR